MSQFAISIGCFKLKNFVRLNVAYLRRVFGDDAPIFLYDSPSEENGDIRLIAADYGCAYACEPVNRGHFAGDVQAAVAAVAMAQHHGCEFALKVNQRTILLSPEIPSLLEQAFSDPQVTLVTPGRYPEVSIIDPASRFHGRFPQAVDVLCFRAAQWDAQGIGDRYKTQWTTSTSRYGAYSEVFWANEVKRIGAGAHRVAPWLSAHVDGEPFKFLRKIQNREEHYNEAARQIGLPLGAYPLQEWMKLRRNYQPQPRA